MENNQKPEQNTQKSRRIRRPRTRRAGSGTKPAAGTPAPSAQKPERAVAPAPRQDKRAEKKPAEKKPAEKKTAEKKPAPQNASAPQKQNAPRQRSSRKINTQPQKAESAQPKQSRQVPEQAPAAKQQPSAKRQGRGSGQPSAPQQSRAVRVQQAAQKKPPVEEEKIGLELISRRPPKQKFANFEEYLASRGGESEPITGDSAPAAPEGSAE